ncbi:branched-chain amino acid ABC transporter permease [Acidisphaera sp. S103]|uniref:branched-chain amino acid ABC transporter permease n=1 Tax=Acidisphaera sp. S103 TaxID=1747223 RepID=UPI00131CA961|nr:branched-chain amino acid ABC transporter permease [Acidisphaera sp. S103]
MTRRDASRWHPAEYAFWALPIVAYFVFPDHLALLAQIAIAALFAVSLDLILGYAGIVSLGHAAFFGIGAYAAGLLAQAGWGDPVLGLACATLAAAVTGFATSFLVLRGADLTRLMVTLGVASMLYVLANKLTDITGGLDGLQGVEMKPIFGQFAFDLYGKTAYVYCTIILFVMFWIARRVVHSPFGLSLQGIRQNAVRMPALGTPVNARLVAVYTLGAAYAGIAGALLTQTTQFVSIDVFSFSRSAEVLLILVLGGIGSLYGGILGAVVFMTVHEYLSGIDPLYWQFWLGLLLIVVVLFARGGIMGTLRLASKVRA